LADKKQNTEFKVTARKYRPQIFSDVTSQQFIVRTLLNSIKNKKISHSYLFTGPRGVGKTTIARLLAKAINCKDPKPNGEPCNECESCSEIREDNRNHPDVFEIDGASNRNIEDVRELKEKVKYGPIRSKYKVFIIDEVHMLTGASFNALLKTLEEPPLYVVFIFATTSPEKVPLTILGRCQRYDFKRLTIEEIISRIKVIAQKEKIKIDETSLYYIAKKGDGSMRDAQGLFDMTSAYCNNDITFDKMKEFFNIAESDVFFNISELIKSKNCKELLIFFDKLVKNGHSLETLLDGLTMHYRNMLIAVSTGNAELINEPDNAKQKYIESKSQFTEIELLNSLKLILQTEYTFKYSFNQRTLFEALLIELVKYTESKEITTIIEELNELKKNFKDVNLTSSDKPATNGKLPETKKDTDGSKPRSVLQMIEEQAKQNENLFRESIKEDTQQEAESEYMDDKTASEIWESLLGKMEHEGKRWIYSLLKKSEFNINGKMFEIMINDDQYDMLNDHKDYIRDRINRFFRDKRTIEIIKRSDKVEGAEKESITSSTNHERIKKILIEEFKGKLKS
jgi:DNA polymerase-3 subunit gamma/tau